MFRRALKTIAQLVKAFKRRIEIFYGISTAKTLCPSNAFATSKCVTAHQEENVINAFYDISATKYTSPQVLCYVEIRNQFFYTSFQSDFSFIVLHTSTNRDILSANMLHAGSNQAKRFHRRL